MAEYADEPPKFPYGSSSKGMTKKPFGHPLLYATDTSSRRRLQKFYVIYTHFKEK